MNNEENSAVDHKKVSIALTPDAFLPLLLDQAVQIRASLTTLLALESEVLAHFKGTDPDEERSQWFQVRDDLCGEFAAQLEQPTRSK